MKTRILVSGLLYLISMTAVVAQQPTLAWAQQYSGKYSVGTNDKPVGIAVDAAGNSYVTGSSLKWNPYSETIITVKYAPSGEQLWVMQSDDYTRATAIAVDNQGGVYVTGESYGSGSSDFITLRYNAATGEESWVQRYGETDANNDGRAEAIVVDNQGGVYVTGSSGGEKITSVDYVTIRYDAATGTQTWASRYGVRGNSDLAKAIAIDNKGGVYVAGHSYNSVTRYDYSIVRYDAATGQRTWASRYNSPANDTDDQVTDMAADNAGGLYITGYSFHSNGYSEYTTVRYDAVTGKQTWVSKYGYNTGLSATRAYAIALDNAGGLYVTGNNATIRYAAASGEQTWIQEEGGTAIALDNGGSVYITDSRWDNGDNSFNSLYATFRYNAATGEQVWAEQYSSGSSDVAVDMAMDSEGSLIITGVTGYTDYNSEMGEDFLTLKYSQVGNTLAVQSFTLVNASNEQDLMPLSNGDTVDLTALPTRALNIRANTSRQRGINVKFALSGQESRSWTELGSPYVLFGDEGGNYHAWSPAPGTYTLTATPYTDAGERGTTLTISFTIVNKVAVQSFTLVNATNEQDLMPLADGDTINLAALPSHLLNIRANTSQRRGINVKFVLSGQQSRTWTERGFPYALFGDEGGDFYGWTPPSGTYTLAAKPYTHAGRPGAPMAISFTIVEQFTAAAARNMQAADQVSAAAVAYPNPTHVGKIKVVLPQQMQGEITYTLVSLLGTKIAGGELSLSKPAREVEFDFSAKMQNTGVYLLHLKAHNLQTVLRVVRQ
ncbi:SBBP repeat-containing protein [Pontibacter sp. 172403-2]|uniref:SBBP repeat-containing protein n=1 Tax=Pontibacter rufus TaxID=2791028 RepID=UPI0018AFC748|nr:SBBP repeat-containing protein [Pontibacter sp. 172403-2]MBF9255687.1 SBBP repeat-containing protein [Pontibacter sp. 172403-2]